MKESYIEGVAIHGGPDHALVSVRVQRSVGRGTRRPGY